MRRGGGRFARLLAGMLLACLGMLFQATVALADMTFSTLANWRVLSVPWYQQIHGLDCEAAALQMALAYTTRTVSQDTILANIPVDSRTVVRDSYGNVLHWGDPYVDFVGNVDGAERYFTGYGVYYPPIANAARHFGATVVQAAEGVAPSTLYQALLNGNPVVAWVSFDWVWHQNTSYVAFDGRRVQFGAPYEHAVTLAGVTGDYVLVNDPDRSSYWLPKSTFEPAYATFNRMAVILKGSASESPRPSSSSTLAGAEPVPADSFHPLAPARIVDTRFGVGVPNRAPLGPGGSMTVQVTGMGLVPSNGVNEVSLNVTATDTTAMSFMKVYPAGINQPISSNLNWNPGQTVANLVQTAVSADGKVTITNDSGSTDVVVDVEGWFGPTPDRQGLYNGIKPGRLLDTRSGLGGGTLPAGSTRSLAITGLGGVPASGAEAVVLNLTVTNPSQGGWITAFPHGTAKPNASNVNFGPGQTLANRVVVQLGQGGRVDFYNGSGGSVDLIADINGWYSDASGATGGGKYTAVGPMRLLDTRNGMGRVPLGGDATVKLADTQAIGVSAVVVNVVNADSTDPSWLTVWPTGVGLPNASDSNFASGWSMANLVVVKLGSDGSFKFKNANGWTDVIIDLVGYYGPLQ